MAEQPTGRPTRRRWWLLAAIPAGLVLLAVAAFLVWALNPSAPTETALAALESDGDVTVSEVSGGWVFKPASSSVEPTAVLVFYPGGHVDARAYATYARDVAQQGNAVALAKMPLSLAVLKPNAADELLGAPELAGTDRWAIGGHSLGGVMAARYAASNPDEIDGLVLLASYPDSAADLSASPIAVASVTGTVDGVLNREAWGAAKSLLPSGTAFVSIEGGNHAQFGDYGPQSGDNPATISIEEQRERSVGATQDVLSRLGGDH